MKVAALIQGKSVVTVEPGLGIDALLGRLRDHNVGALVVSADGRDVAGIVSERDVVRAMPDRLEDLAHLTVRDLMTADVITCTPDTTVGELMALMTQRRVRHVPVVDDDGALVSIVSIGDVVKVHISEIDAEREALRTYITS
jgi:CBS domain-containing protein